MSAPRDDATFLAGSSHRFTVLEALADSSSLEDLAAAAGVSRTTLWRTLTAFESRGWAERHDDGYRITPVGTVVADAFGALLDSLSVVAEMDDLIQWLPQSEMGFDLARLAEADVARPTPSDPQAPLRLARDQTAGARTVQLLTHAVSPAIVEVVHEGVMAGTQELEAVVTQAAIDAMAADQALNTQFQALLDADAASVYRAGSDVPHILAIFDGDRVGLGVDDDQGRPLAVLDSRDPVVVDWATTTFEAYRAAAEPLDP